VVKPLLLIIYAANQHTNYLLFTLTQRSAELTSDPYFIAEWRRCEWILTFTQPIEQMTSVGMRKKIKQIAGTFVTLVIVVLSPDGFSGTAHAEDSDSDRFNYGFLEQYRDGFYIGTNENANIYQLPLSFTVRNLRDYDWGLKLKFPVDIGIFNIDSSDGDIDFDLLSFSLGMELQFPVRDFWIIMPLFTLGGAKDLSGGSTKFIYSSGIKSHLLFDLYPLDLTLGNALRNAGYTTFSGGPRDNFWSIETGLDVRFPLGFMIWRKEMLLSIYGVNYFFLGDVVVVESKPEPIEVHLQWEFGLTLGPKEGWRILFFDLSRVGVGYKFGEGLGSLRLFIGMPF
jgi:hypothetical protein